MLLGKITIHWHKGCVLIIRVLADRILSYLQTEASITSRHWVTKKSNLILANQDAQIQPANLRWIQCPRSSEATGQKDICQAKFKFDFQSGWFVQH
jgi:hypothetical protein